MKRTSLALVAVVFAVGLTWGAESAAPTQPAATPDQAAAAADQAATSSTDAVTVASNKVPGGIPVPSEINSGGTCPTVSGSSCPATACVDPNGGGEVCHKIGCTLTNTGMHGCTDGEGEFFGCGFGKTIWVSACQCGCLGESCGSYGSWFCR